VGILRAVPRGNTEINTDRMIEITIKQLQVIWAYFDEKQIAELYAYLPEEQEEILDEINVILKDIE
jgi:hypothetical protein